MPVCHPSARTVPASRSKITAAHARPIGSTPSWRPTRRGSRSALSAASAEASTTIAAALESRPLALCLVPPAASSGRAPATQTAREPFPIVSDRERVAPAMAPDASVDLESLIRRVIREECGITAVTPAEKWRGGTLVLRPGTPGLQEKSLLIETFFHKVVMLRNRLRSLEQQVNAAELPEDVKLKLQGYVTGCYGSLTSFNVLFADEDDQFKGAGGDEGLLTTADPVSARSFRRVSAGVPAAIRRG